MNAVLSLVITGGELKILMDSHFDFSLCLSLTRVSLLAKVNACKLCGTMQIKTHYVYVTS